MQLTSGSPRTDDWRYSADAVDLSHPDTTLNFIQSYLPFEINSSRGIWEAKVSQWFLPSSIHKKLRGWEVLSPYGSLFKGDLSTQKDKLLGQLIQSHSSMLAIWNVPRESLMPHSSALASITSQSASPCLSLVWQVMTSVWCLSICIVISKDLTRREPWRLRDGEALLNSIEGQQTFATLNILFS